MLSKRIILVIYVIFFLSIIQTTTLVCQQKDQIKVMDKNTGESIIGATYEYDGQTGITDEKGYIEIYFQDGKQITLSHISYGEWILDNEKVEAAIKNGYILKEEQTILLYPVTVIALHSGLDQSQTMVLDYEHKVSHDGGAVLNHIAAISSIRKGGNYGFDPVLRGFKYDQLNVVLNGIQTAAAACPNRMDPPTSQMAPNMIDRIEILKGPHSVRYGNALGGTINFISTSPRFSINPSVYGRISGRYDHNGKIMRSEGLLGYSKENYYLDLFASWSQGDDYKDGELNHVQADFFRASAGINFKMKLSEQQFISLSATHNLARDADFPALPMDLREDNTWLFSGKHSVSFHDALVQKWETAFYGTFVDHRMNNYLKIIEPRMVNAETEANTYSIGGRTELTLLPVNGKLFAGIDFRGEGAQGDRIRNFLTGPNTGNEVVDNVWQNGSIYKTGLFSEYHHQWNSIHLVIAGRLEVNRAEIKDADNIFTAVYSDTKSTQLNPVISLGGMKILNRYFSAGLWFGRAQRSGNLTERYINYFPVGQDPYEMLGNPEIEPEINNQADLTFKIKSDNTGISLDIFMSLVQNNISSVIDTGIAPRLPSSPGVRVYTNINRAFKTGFELDWNQNLMTGLQHRMSIAYTYGEDMERKEPLPEVAPFDFRYVIAGNYMDKKLKPEISFRHVLRQSRISKEFGESVTPSFTVIDLSLSYKFSKLSVFSAGVQNILNETYYEHLNRSVRGTIPYPINAPGRNFYLSLTVEFNSKL